MRTAAEQVKTILTTCLEEQAPAPEPQPPAAKSSQTVTWESLAERFQEMAYSEKPEEIPNTLDWVEVKAEETQAGDANGWQVEGHPSVADGSDTPKELFQLAAKLAGRKLLRGPGASLQQAAQAHQE